MLHGDNFQYIKSLKMADKEVEIGNKTIGENTKITLSIKTALWIIGGSISLFSILFTMAYFDIKSDVEDYKKKVQQVFDEKLDKMSEKHETILKDMGDIKTNVGIILDRTSGVRHNTSDNLNQNNNTPPR